MLPTVKDICQLNEGALEIRISDSIERIDNDSIDAAAGQLFLKHSYLTNGMKELVNEGFKRLSGSSGGRPVFRLKQAMGGGKTHLIKTMAFLARHPKLRTEFFPETSSRYAFGAAQVAFFNGREQPNDYFWGRIAAQLGSEGFFKAGTESPGQEHWQALFDNIEAPVLILLDEMPTYFGYYRTQAVGSGTVADIAGRAFANLLTASSGKKNICIIVSDLEASYAEGTQIINAALESSRKELNRIEFNITPVDLSGDETYAILKKRLFSRLPDNAQIAHIAESFGKAIEQAQRSKTIEQQKSPEQLASEVEQTYPFHPQMKHIFALFKENKEFQQTRGLLELASRLLKSVWERKENDVMLIGPQHFDLSIDEVREKIISISRLDDAVARDIYSSDGSAHAQTIDANAGNDAAAQVANLLLVSSLSTAVNPVKGLTLSETLECLATPNADLSFYQQACENLTKSSWYLHKSAEGRIYFDKLENLTKMLTGLAARAPEPKVSELIAHRLREAFEPKSKRAYQKVLALPSIDEIEKEVQVNRVLAIISPDSKLPPEEVGKLFSTLVRKNNLLVLTGEKSFEVGKLHEAARQVYAVGQANTTGKVKKGDPQWEEFEDLKASYEHQFNSVVKSLFDKLLFPSQRPGLEPKLEARPLEHTGNTTDGENQIIATLTKDPVKLYVDWVESTKFSGVRSRIERLFENQDEVAWSDIRDRAQSNCSMYFLVPGDLERIKQRAITEALWEDLQNGWISKKPKPKVSGVQVLPLGQMNDAGKITLEVTVLNSNPETTHVHYAENGEVSTESPKLNDRKLVTDALTVAFLAVDYSGKTETGQPKIWKNELKIQWEITPEIGKVRTVRIPVLPRADTIRYTLDGSEPRNGREYTGPFEVDNQPRRLLIFAEASGLEKKADYQIVSGDPGSGRGVAKEPPLTLPVLFPVSNGVTLNSRELVFSALNKASERNVVFDEVQISVQHGQAAGRLDRMGQPISGEKLLHLLSAVIDDFSPTASLTIHFRNARFQTGQDMIDFAQKIGHHYKSSEWQEA